MVWAGLWNKRVWADYEHLLRPIFSFFGGWDFFWKHYSICSEKLQFFFYKIFLTPEKVKKTPRFFRAKNLSVNTRRSEPDICSLICGPCWMAESHIWTRSHKNPQKLLTIGKFPGVARIYWALPNFYASLELNSRTIFKSYTKFLSIVKFQVF